MTDRVDILFSGNLPSPPKDHGPRLNKIEQTLWAAIVLNVLGIPCWTSVPGAILTLWAWLATAPDAESPISDPMSPSDTERLARLRKRANITLVFCVVALIVQIVLLSTTFYERLWGSMSVAINHLWQSI
jgi:hypothetical protein